MKKTVLVLGSVCLIIAMVITGCTATTTAPTTTAAPTTTPVSGEPIKIGAVYDLTGWMITPSMEAMQGSILAFEQAGYEVAGRPIEYIIEDGATDVGICMDKSRKLVEQDKVCLVFGCMLAGAWNSVGPYYSRVQVPVMTYAPNDPIPESLWSWHPSVPHEGMGYLMGRYAGQQGYKKASTLYAEMECSHLSIKGFKKGFEEEGGEVIQEQYWPTETMDFSPYITKISGEADLFVPWAPGATALAFFTQIDELGIKLPMIADEAGGAMEDLSGITQELGDSILGLTTAMVWYPDLDLPASKKFLEDYRQRWDCEPSHFAACSYSNVQLVLAALEMTGGDESNEALANALNSVSIDTVRGHVSFGPNRFPTHDIYIGEVVCVDGWYQEKEIGAYKIWGDVVDGEFVYGIIE
jgi:branched-chain amino acid transport system substrate-binding protein